MNNDSIPDIEIMINRMVDDELTSDQRACVERELIRDPSANAMLRDYETLDDQCRDAIAATLSTEPPAERREPIRSWTLVSIASAVAAAVVLGVVLWPVFTERPNNFRTIVDAANTPAHPALRKVKLAVDQFDPAPLQPAMTNPVRNTDRVPVGLYDAESGQMKIILVDHQQEQQEFRWEDL
ncbi:MAG: hypothetical protein HN350_11845 [Phycisphaerales bacterium]|jgi:hypothetical protein|nr:hypothetical protein [Phycisphaerales bacterium]